MNENDIKNLIQQQINAIAQTKQYTVAQIPSHVHNGIDSNQIQFVGSLSDTPTTYTGQAGKAAIVNATETALEFGTPSSVTVNDYDIIFHDVTTGDVSITEHGFAPKAPNDATKYLDGTGSYSVPSSGTSQLTVGTLSATLAKTYFNMQLPFILATGAATGDVTTSFVNWTRTGTSDVVVSPMGTSARFASTADVSIYMAFITQISTTARLRYNSGISQIISDWFCILPLSYTGDVRMGFGDTEASFSTTYNDTVKEFVGFALNSGNDHIYAVSNKVGSGITTVDLTAIGVPIANTVWNDFRVELNLGTSADFYVNGVLKTTISTNIPASGTDISLGFGRSDTNNFTITAPNFSIKLV